MYLIIARIKKIEHLKTSQSVQQKHTVQQNYGKPNINTTFVKQWFEICYAH